MEFVVFWLLCAIVVGVIAGSRGRSGFGWFLLACIISPLLAVILVLALGSATKADSNAPTALTHVKCPDCREFVLRDARKCKHCGASLVPQGPSPEPANNQVKAMGIVVLVAAGMAVSFYVVGSLLK
jgi:hypothetical protein